MIVCGMKVDIKIQSISDIITNSSSEVFCTITGEDVKSIYEILSPLFKGDPDSSPFLSYWKENEYDEDTPEMIQLNIPYSCSGVCEFYKAGMEAVLDKYVWDKNYQIEYED
jgi:hypothetical protein